MLINADSKRRSARNRVRTSRQRSATPASLLQRVSPGKWPDRIHEYSVPCISEIHSESVTRFISCMISRNSSVTHFRIDPPREPVRNGSSWKRAPPRASVRLFSQHAGDVDQQSTLGVPRVLLRALTSSTVRTVGPDILNSRVTVSEFSQ